MNIVAFKLTGMSCVFPSDPLRNQLKVFSEVGLTPEFAENPEDIGSLKSMF